MPRCIFLYAVPRLIFLTAPLLFLYFGLSNVPGYWLAILAFAMPHLALTTITNSRIQGSKRFSFWNEIYETVLSPYILLPTFLALINPKSGKFNVTDKGGAQDSGYFSLRLAVPYLVLLAMNLTGLALVVPRYFYWDRGAYRRDRDECVLGVVQCDDPGRRLISVRGGTAAPAFCAHCLRGASGSAGRRGNG